MELNSNGKAISGVGINVISSNDVQPVMSDANGIFILKFSEKQAGDAISFRVSKPDYETVNTEILKDRWILTEKDTLNIIMAPFWKLDEARALYYGIIDQYQLEKYQNTINELKENLRQEQISFEEYQRRTLMAEEALQNASEQIDMYADRFARINRDQMDSISQKAFEALDKGDIDAAIKIYDEADLLEQLKNKVAARDEVATSINNLIPALKEEAQLRLLVSGEKNRKKAGEILEQIALADTNSFYNIIEYIYFLDDENEIEKTIHYCNLAMRTTNGNIALISSIYNLMGRVTLRNKEYKRAEEYLLKSIETVNSRPYSHLYGYLYALNFPLHNLSVLYLQSNNLDKAEVWTNKALEVRRKLSELDSTMLGAYANTLSTTGKIHYLHNEYDKAKSIYLKSIEIEKRLAKTDPTEYLPILAGFMNELGTIYYNLNEIDSAFILFGEAINIWEKQLTYISEAYYKGRYIQTMRNFGMINEKLAKYDTAELYYKKAIAVSKEAELRNPNIYNDITANSLYGFGNYYQKMERLEESKDYFLEALLLYKKMNLKFGRYYDEIAETCLNIGGVYQKMNQTEETRKYYKEALSIYKKLEQDNKEKYSTKVKETRLAIRKL